MSRPIDRTLRRIPNLFPFLLILISLGLLPSSHHALNAVRALSTVLVTPVLLPLSGFLSQKLASGGKRLFRLSIGMMVLYGGMSVLTFWARAAGRGKSFSILTGMGACWFFLVAAECHVGAWLLEWVSQRNHWKKRFVFAVLVALSVVSGYLPLYRNVFCFGRLTLCLPLFLMGRWMDPYALLSYLKEKWVKPLGCAVLLAVLALCWFQTDLVLTLSKVLLGASAYRAPAVWGYPALGGLVRLVQLAGGAALTLFFLSLSPNRKIPVLSYLGRRFYVGYFFHAPILYLLNAWMNSDTLAVDLLRMVLIVVLPLAACTALFQYPVRRFAMSITALLVDGDDRCREGHPSPAFWFYCLGFGLLVSMYASVLVAKGKTFIWQPDGEDLYVTIMYYTRDYILNVFKTLFTTGRFVLPQYDFSIGQGAGILSVLHLNPLFLLAMFFPRSALEQVYGFYALGQLFLAGLAFRYFASYLGIKRRLPVWLGALTYAFSGFCIFTAAKHIYFITYMVVGLPLLLAGCERWLQKRKWGLFVVTVVFLFLGGYYYTWMDSLLMAIYLVVVEIHRYRPNLKKILVDCFQLLGLYLWGMGLSMVFFLPAISNLFSSSRAPTAEGEGLSLFVPLSFARKILHALFCVVPDAPSWTRLGFIGLMLVALVVLFLRLRNREWAPLRILAILLFLFLFLPVMGSLFNGLGYSTNRWNYGIALLNAVIFAVLFPHLTRLSRVERWVSTALAVAYCVFELKMDNNQLNQLTVVMVLGCVAVVWLANYLPNQKYAESLLALVTVFALMVNTGYYFRAYRGQNAEAYVSKGKAAAKYTTSSEAITTGLEDSLYRVELHSNRRNSFCLTGGNGTSTYWSVLDSTQVNYYLDFELDTVRQVYSLWGLDERADLCAVAAVKYYATQNEAQVPYGFTEYRMDETTGLTIYQNQFALPFGYTYTSYISREDYDDLEPIQRQQALLQGAVVESKNEATVSKSLDQIYPSLTERKVSWRIVQSDGMEIDGTNFHVTKSDATLTLAVDGQAGCETYLWMPGLRYKGGGGESAILVSDGQMSKKGKLYQSTSLYGFERAGTTWNVGYHERPLNTITLTFDNPGQYQADDLQVLCLPMAQYTDQVNQLGQVVLENVEETLNGGLTGQIKVKDTRLLALAVPYSNGWTLTLNGQPAELFQVNGMYLGTVLKPGSYNVELTYHAPGVIPGAAVTGVSLVGLLAYAIFYQLRKSSERQAQSEQQASN